MKRVLILVFILAGLVAGGYTAGAWWLGKQVERNAQAKFTKLQGELPPWFTINHSFQRGLFHSEETDTLNICLPPCSQPTRINIQTRIMQLPLPGLFHKEVASADSVVQLDPAIASAWTGGQPLAKLHTTFHFNGSGSTTFSMPAINSTRMKSVAGQIQVDFTKDMASYTQQGSLPGFTFLTNQPGVNMTLTGLQISGNHSLIAPYTHLYGGTDHIQIDQMGDSTGRIAQIKLLTLDGTASSSGNGLMDMKVNYGARNLAFAGQDYGPAHFNISFHHLDAATLDSMSQEQMNMQNDPAQAMAAMKTLLMRDPEISIDQFSFNVPAGEAMVTADLKVQGVTQSDFANPLAIVGKLQATADLKLPDSLVALLTRPSAQPGAPDWGAKLDTMVKAGFLNRAAGFTSTHLEMNGGKLTLNGKPFNPLALAR